MECTACRFDNPKGLKFCGQCGTPLVTVCPECGFANPPAFRFCGECGGALETGASATDPRLPAEPAA